jgi:hypothetical protein
VHGVWNHPHPIPPTHPEYYLSDFPYEKPDRHTLQSINIEYYFMKRIFYLTLIKLSKLSNLPPTFVSILLVWCQFAAWWYQENSNQVNFPEFDSFDLKLLIGETIFFGVFIYLIAPKWWHKKPENWGHDGFPD